MTAVLKQVLHLVFLYMSCKAAVSDSIGMQQREDFVSPRACGHPAHENRDIRVLCFRKGRADRGAGAPPRRRTLRPRCGPTLAVHLLKNVYELFLVYELYKPLHELCEVLGVWVAPGGRETLQKGGGDSPPPTFLEGLPAARGRPEPQNRRFPACHKIMH